MKIKILDNLDFGIPVTSIELNIENEEFVKILNEMSIEGLITYGIIENHPVFSGVPKDIRITEKGRKYLEESR